MKLKPQQKQLDFLDWEFGVFFHFGIRSFYPGHRDWDKKEMPISAFDPKELDCRSWAKIVKKAGARYAILTAKHHDGFALWPTAYSEYSVAHAPWKNGKGDVVREFVDACREEGLKVGLYYSPAQWGGSAVSFTEDKAYDDYFIGQISELLTNYGPIDYLWFDGAGSAGHEYDKPRIRAAINSLQPNLLTFCDPDWAPGVLWVGNEDGFAPLDNPLEVNSWDFGEQGQSSGFLQKKCFLPRECDCKMRNTWFYDQNEDTVKSLDELFGMYEGSVGRGANLLLDIGPDPRGLLPGKDSKRLLELGEKIRRVYGNPVDLGPMKKSEEGTYTITNEEDFANHDIFESPKVGLANRVVLEEDLSEGQAVTSFILYAYLPYYRFAKIPVYQGYTIGHKCICPIPAIRSPRFELKILSSNGEVKMRDMKAYYCE